MMEAWNETRRAMLTRLVGFTGGILAAPLALYSQLRASPQPVASPNAPTNQNVPGGLDGVPLAHDTRAINPLLWTEIKNDSDKLLQMATDLKAKIDQTNLSAVLPLPLIKEAHQIEKIAKDIQGRMRS